VEDVVRTRTLLAGLVLAGLLPALAAESPPDDAARVLDRFFTASGGLERLQSLKSLAADAEREVYGGGYSVRLLADGRFRIEAPDRTVVFDGRDHWLSYRGLVQPLAGDELAGYRRVGLREFVFHGLLDAGGAPAALTYTGQERAHGQLCDVLAGTSPEGHPRRYRFNAASGLLESIVETVPDSTLRELKNVYAFTDYQPAGGMLLPTRTQAQCLTNGNELDPLTRFTSLRIDEPIDEALLRRPDAMAPPVAREERALVGEVLAISGGGSLITNITRDDLAALGVADSTALLAHVRGRDTRLTYRPALDFATVRPGEYLATFNGTPALWLVKAYQGMRSDDSTYAAGDAVRLTVAPTGANAADAPRGE
jgi:hypothetical protein